MKAFARHNSRTGREKQMDPGENGHVTNFPVVESLPQDRAELELRWPRQLKTIMEEVLSPADPETLERNLRNNPSFMALIEGWDNMPTASQANCWNMIQERLRIAALSSRPFCRRCGECCLRGSPVLFEQDRPVLASGEIRRCDLITLRTGERAFSNRLQTCVSLDNERVKIKEVPGSRSCIFLSPGRDACLIYSDRPHQCRVLECWDPSRYDTLLTLPPLTRFGLLGLSNPLSDIIGRHEERTSVTAMAASLAALKAGDDSGEETALQFILYDLHTREFVMDTLGLKQDELDFFFGRPMAFIAMEFGYKTIFSSDGLPYLERMAVSDDRVESP
jgi:Fe-S-cluster containining protein